MLATGRAEVSGRVPVGEVIERAVAMLAHTGNPIDASQGVRFDEVTAGLLDVHFDVTADASGLLLRGKRAIVDATTRTLLGKNVPCVGRERELDSLMGVLDECVGEPIARLVMVTGEAGTGKSRVRHELLQRARRRDTNVEVWLGRGDPVRAGSPFTMIAPPLLR